MREWYKRNKQKFKEKHKIWYRKNKKKMKLYEFKNRDKRNAAKRKLYKHRRKLVVTAYGGKCDCCGEKYYEFLSIDHVGGGGTRERKKMNGKRFFNYLINNNYPKNYRLLCHNCNQSLGVYGYCPHSMGMFRS